MYPLWQKGSLLVISWFVFLCSQASSGVFWSRRELEIPMIVVLVVSFICLGCCVQLVILDSRSCMVVYYWTLVSSWLHDGFGRVSAKW